MVQHGLERHLHWLERDGLVSRRRDPRDGRAVLIFLTRDGREIVPSRHADRTARLARLAEQLDDREQETLAGRAAVLARLTEIAAGRGVRRGPPG